MEVKIITVEEMIKRMQEIIANGSKVVVSNPNMGILKREELKWTH